MTQNNKVVQIPRRESGETRVARRVSVRAQVSEWLEPRFEASERVDVSKSMPGLVRHFMADEEFVEQLLTEALYPIAIDVARRMMRRGRGAPPVVAGGVVQTRSDFEREAEERPSSPFADWWERAESSYIRLPKMNRLDLAGAIEGREKPLRTERIRLRFLRLVRRGMPEDDSVLVEDVFGDEDLQRLHEQARKEVDDEIEEENA